MVSRKVEIQELAENACDALEGGEKEKFFSILESVLTQKIPFGDIHPLGITLGERGVKDPELYFDVLDGFFKKDLDFGYREGLYNIEYMKMSPHEVKRSRVLGWRAGIIGMAFNEMSQVDHEKVVERTKGYIIESAHWSASDTFADKTFNRLFQDRFQWILDVQMEWARHEDKWLRNAAGFVIHAPVQRGILDRKQFKRSLKLLDILMTDPDTNVKKKVAWTLKITSKVYPEETYDFVMKWAKVSNRDSRWIINNGIKNLTPDKQKDIKRTMGEL